MKKCRHNWIWLALDKHGGHIKGDWYWCNLCGATKHYVHQKDYFGLEKNGVYIRHVGKDEKAIFVRKF